MFMAYAIVAALYARATSGKGQRIETSLFASGLAAQYRPLLSIEETDRPVREGFLAELKERRTGEFRHAAAEALRREYIAPRGRNNYYRVYETRDALIAVACLHNGQRRALRDSLGVTDPTIDGMRYDWFSEEVRSAHIALGDDMEKAFRLRTTAAWIERLDEADVPCGPVNFPEEMFDHPQVLANSFMADLDHDSLGALRMPASPVAMSDTPMSEPVAPPVLGAHTVEVLLQCGYTPSEVDDLI